MRESQVAMVNKRWSDIISVRNDEYDKHCYVCLTKYITMQSVCETCKINVDIPSRLLSYRFSAESTSLVTNTG